MMVDFWTFSCIPVALLKRVNISESLSASLMEPLQKIRISSTNNRWAMFKFAAFFIPSKRPLIFASSNALVSPSATSRKMRGERGHPWRNSLSEWKKWELAPFMRIAKEAVEMQAKIHFING